MNLTWLATRALVGGAVLCLAAGAASASGPREGAASAVRAEAARLQQAWGPDVVRNATVAEGSATLLVATTDSALLHASSAQQWLHARFPVTLLNVKDLGPNAGLSEPSCGAAAPMAGSGSGASSHA